jgi:phosphoglycolate phosphatase
LQRYFFCQDFDNAVAMAIFAQKFIMASIKTIIWDWNGTLLNDLDICITGINRLLTRRGLKCLEKEHYRQIFTFPVKDYYLAAGFDFSKEAFEVPAEEYITEYHDLLPGASLFADVVPALGRFQQMGYRQFILSAMEQQALLKSVDSLGIFSYFNKICGIENNLAFSKIHSGKKLLSGENIDPSTTVLIGDTLHDYEVGKELGVEVFLLSRGHQCHSRLNCNGNRVFENLDQVFEILS